MASVLLHNAFAWLITYGVHSTIMLAVVLMADRTFGARFERRLEFAWRLAFFGSMITASAQVLLGAIQPQLMLSHHFAPRALVGSSLYATLGDASSLAPRAVSALLGIWLLGALLQLGKLSRCYMLLRSITAKRTRVTLPPTLCNRTSILLTTCSSIGTPVALGLREICVPTRALTELTAAEFTAVLAHEYAHLVRCDTLWLGFGNFMRSIFWFQPLNAIALRRLRELAERACDDSAIEATHDPIALASALARVSEWLRDAAMPAFAVAMASAESAAVSRVRRILDVDLPRIPLVNNIWQRWMGALLTASLTIVLPGVPAVRAFEGAFTVQAHDPAGAFAVTLDRATVVGVTVDGRSIDRGHIQQSGDRVHIDAPGGPIDLRLAPHGFHWTSRPGLSSRAPGGGSAGQH